jgi:hypothetical protein
MLDSPVPDALHVPAIKYNSQGGDTTEAPLAIAPQQP